MLHPASSWRRIWLRATLVAAASMALAACNLAPFTPASAPTPAPTVAASEPDASPEPTEAAEATPRPTPEQVVVAEGEQPIEISGEFDYTNTIITTYYVEHAVALMDMYGFVKRDKEWEIPVDSQVLGYLDLDEQKQHGSYRLLLPARPQATMADVDRDGDQDAGVQIFVVSYMPNLTGSPFAIGDDRERGWPSYLASTVNDAENQDEVIGGKLVVWAPDANQQFPTDFGPDGRLFTDDDPVGPIPAGYSVVDLDRQPFGVSQAAEQELPLYEPADVGIKDFTDLSYTEAFKRMFEQVRREYAFNDVPGKSPEWDALYAELLPRVERAERSRDGKGFYLALRDFTFAFRDGHVGLSGGRFADEVFSEEAGGGYGFAIRELDDGRVIVVYVLEGGPAAEAGMRVGAEVTEFNGKPIGEAIGAVRPLEGPYSTDFSLRYHQQRYLLRAPLDTEASVTFANQGQSARTVTLTAVPEYQSLAATSPYRDYDPNALPVEFRLLESGVGYVQINSNYDDLNLIVRLFERALKTFDENGVPGIIIDMRRNFGGAPLGLAGFLTDEEIPLGQLEYYSDKSGTFEPEGPPDEILPNENQYRFDEIALLVGLACSSACEIEAYGFSQVPGTVVLGQYPSSGMEAEVARGQFELPDGISLQVPTGRFKLPDGSIFLEGQGVEPTRRIPIDERTVLSDEDVVLQEAERAVR